MKERGLISFFEEFLNKKPIFKNKQAMQDNYTPNTIFHRDEEIKNVANILATCLRKEKPSNLFIYGKTGTGKTLTVKYVSEQLQKIASKKNIHLKIIYLNCKLKKVADTEYRIIAQLAKDFGKAVPPTGLPTEEVYNIFFSAVDKKEQTVVLILDEIDQLVGRAGDEILYNLTRVNSSLQKTQISLVGISNDLVFTEALDPRVKSSLSEESIVFPPYNALQIQSILKQRAKEAFNPDILSEGVIEKCAAYSAREHGDARRALELLRVAAEIAERNNLTVVEIKHIDEAEEKVERERILDLVATQPKQHQVTLYSIFVISEKKKEPIFTGEVYELYQRICSQISIRPLTQRRISDIIAEFDMLGIVTAKVISKGRYGRTRELSISTASPLNTKIKKILEESLNIA